MAFVSPLPAVFLVILALSYNVQVEAQSFPITKYGAKSGGDISEAILDAFKAACAATGASEVVIPKGTWESGPVRLEGPCKTPSLRFVIQGTVEAPLKIDTPGWFTFVEIQHLTITGGGTLDGKGQEMWKGQPKCLKQVTTCKSHSITMRLDKCNNTLVEGITSLNSKNFHINVIGCHNVTFSKVTITAPDESPNTDGIHIGRSTSITVKETNIGTGDDCISVGDGTVDLKVLNVKCGPGHGISVGSLGLYQNEDPLDKILVQGCTLTNTDNGVRIKSWPDKYDCVATNIQFINITMNNVTNPVIVDQTYCPYTKCNTKGSGKVKLDKIVFKGIKGTTPTPNAIQLNCMPGGCKGIELGNIDLKFIGGAKLKGEDASPRANCTNVRPTISGPINPPGCK